jgi:hypothetical protein
VRAALARGQRPSDAALRLASGEAELDDCLDALERLAPQPNRAVPVGTRELRALSEYSMSFDGYAVLGPALAGWANTASKRFRNHGTLPQSVAGARACLFFECRRRVHQARDPDDTEWPYLHALLAVAAK